MIVRQHALGVAATLRSEIPGIRRVLVARTDGLPFYDDGDPALHDSSAAVVATVLGIAQQSGMAFGLEGLEMTTVRGPAGSMVVYAVDDHHLLAVVTEPKVNLVLLDRVVLRLIAGMVGAGPQGAGSLGSGSQGAGSQGAVLPRQAAHAL
jgi:predicted regulator of Ras-like GTPase activity (Roadblock/LC7/MglB family)